MKIRIIKVPNTRAFGGDLLINGANFDNGITVINNGDTHENNIYGGVMVGKDPENTPNLVEEGEVIWNDYVFSNRLKVPVAFRKEYKLGGDLDKPMTFAEAAQKFSEEQKERPNDPISTAGFNALLTTLMDKQELIRIAKQQRDAKREFNALSPEELYDMMLMASLNPNATMMTPMGNPLMPNNMGMPNMEETLMLPYQTQAPAMQGYAYGGSMGNIFEGLGPDPNYLNLNQWLGLFNTRDIDALAGYFGNEGLAQALTIRPESWGQALYTYSKPIGKKDIVTLDMLHDSIAKEVFDRMSKSGAKNITGEAFTAELYKDPRYLANTLYLLNNPMQAAQWLINNGDAKTKQEVQAYLDRNDMEGLKSTINRLRTDNLYGDFHHTFTMNNPASNRNWVMVNGVPTILDNTEGYELVNPGAYLTNIDGFNYNNYLWKKKVAPAVQQEVVTGTPELDTNGLSIPYEPKLTWMRYAPVVGAGVGVLTDLFGLTNKPDESSADAVLKATLSASIPDLINYLPIGNYLAYKPFDRDYYTNKLSAEAGATRRAIQQLATGNAGAAMAGLLAADYNAQGQLGDLFRRAEEYNLEQRQKVEDFNRATNIFNAQQYLTAALANQAAMLRAKQMYLTGINLAEALRQQARLQSTAARSANLTNFLQGLGNIGTENELRNWQRALYSSGYYGYSPMMEHTLGYNNQDIVLNYQRNNPGSSIEDIMNAAGLSRKAVSKHYKKV